TYVTYRATQSALLTALAVLTATIPNALFGFFGGAVADAIGHRRVMLWCDILRAIVLAVVPLLIAIDAPLAVVFAAVLASGLCAVLWSNTVFTLAAQVSTPIFNGLTPAFVIQRFAGNDPAAGAVQFGISEAAIASGAVLGSAVLPRFVAHVRKGRMLILGFASTGAVIVLIAIAPSFAVAVMLFGLLGIANVAFYVPNVTILQEKTAPETRASVFG